MPVFYVVHRHGEQDRSGKHDGRYRKTICISKFLRIPESSDDDDSQSHENPIDCGNVNLALEYIRSAYHLQRRERLHIDDLLEKTERC